MKRQQTKEQTRLLILTKALEEFVQNGYNGTNTARIAQKAGIAHGTVFVHFKNKDELLFEVVKSHLLKISNHLYSAAQESIDLESLCRLHLEFISKELPFEIMLAKQSSTLPAMLKRQIFTIRAGIMAHFYHTIETEIKAEKLIPVDPTIAIHNWFGTLNYYLSNSELFAKPNEIINEKGYPFLNYFIKSLRR